MFGKKSTAEELIKLYSALSEEEKQKFLGAVNGGNEAEPAPEPNPTEEEKGAEQPATPDGEPESAEGTEESQPAPAEESKPEDDTPAENTVAESAPEEDANPDANSQVHDNFAETLEGFGNRLSAIEESIKELTELKEQLQEYTKAQADKFGYTGTIPGNKKSYGEMSAAEMKEKILSGEI